MGFKWEERKRCGKRREVVVGWDFAFSATSSSVQRCSGAARMPRSLVSPGERWGLDGNSPSDGSQGTDRGPGLWAWEDDQRDKSQKRNI